MLLRLVPLVGLGVALASEAVIMLYSGTVNIANGVTALDTACQTMGPHFRALVCGADRNWTSLLDADLFTKRTTRIGTFPQLFDLITDVGGVLPPSGNNIFTGCSVNGDPSANCDDFTNPTGIIEAGSTGDLTQWLAGRQVSCGDSGNIYCIARDQPPAIWVSASPIATPLSSVESLDEKCRLEDYGLFRTYALVCQRAINWLSVLQSQPPVTHKFDGEFVGSAAFTTFSLGASFRLGNGDFTFDQIFTGCNGSFGYQDPGTTCGDWANASGRLAYWGQGGAVDSWFNSGGAPVSCATPGPIYCVRLATAFNLPTIPQTSTFVLSSSNRTAKVVLPPEVLQNGTVIANITPGTNTTLSDSIVSIILQDPFGNIVNVSNLPNPVTITFALKIPINPNAVSQCLGTGFVVEPVLPTCSYLGDDGTTWETDGCSVARFNATHVQCQCTHFTQFAVTAPKNNQLVPEVFLQLTPSNLDANPTGLITVFVILAIFGVMFVIAGLTDRKEAAQYEQLKLAKREKWKNFAAENAKATLWKQVKIAFQKRHTWFSLAFRKSGTSFRSMDRTFVTLLSAFASMSVSAFYHAQDNNDMARVGVIVISALVCAIPSQLLTLLFVRTGPVGFYEEWEQSRNPSRKNKCLSYRFPEHWRHVWRVSTLLVVIALIVYVLAMSVNFDRQPFYFCRGEAAVAWVGTWLLAYMSSVVLIEPLRIVLLATAAHSTYSWRTKTISRVIDTELCSVADQETTEEAETRETEDHGEGGETEAGEAGTRENTGNVL